MPRNPAPGRSQHGYSLVEVVVASAVLGVVLTIIFGALTSFQTAYSRSAARDDAIDQAHLAEQDLGNQITSGNVLYAPGGNGTSLVVYTQTNGSWDCVEWEVSQGGDLTTRSWSQGYPGDGSSPTSWRTVATDIVNTSSEAPFVRPSTFSNRLINIDLYVNETGSSANPVQVETSVEGRNTEYGYPTSACITVPPG